MRPGHTATALLALASLVLAAGSDDAAPSSPLAAFPGIREISPVHDDAVDGSYPGLHVVTHNDSSAGGNEPAWLPPSLRPPRSAGGPESAADESGESPCPPLFAREPISLDEGVYCIHEHGVGSNSTDEDEEGASREIGSLFDWPKHFTLCRLPDADARAMRNESRNVTAESHPALRKHLKGGDSHGIVPCASVGTAMDPRVCKEVLPGPGWGPAVLPDGAYLCCDARCGNGTDDWTSFERLCALHLPYDDEGTNGTGGGGAGVSGPGLLPPGFEGYGRFLPRCEDFDEAGGFGKVGMMGLRIQQGSLRPGLCPAGMYCPNAFEERVCPEGAFCWAGALEPEACVPQWTDLLWGRLRGRTAERVAAELCPEGSTERPGRAAYLPEVLVAMVLLVGLHALASSYFERRAHDRAALGEVALGDARKTDDTAHADGRAYLSAFRLNESRLTLEFDDLALRVRIPQLPCVARLSGAGGVGPEPEVAAPSGNAFAREVPKGGWLKVFDGISSSVEHSTFTALMGSSGCGKTSLLTVLAGREPPNAHYSGSLRINGAEEHPSTYATAMGYVPQDDIVRDSLTVFENLWFAATLRLPLGTTEERRAELVAAVVALLGLDGVLHARVGSAEKRGVSGGQRKRVNIGIELVADPLALFLDEPTSGLDASTAFSVMSALHAMSRRGRTVVTTLHSPRFASMALVDKLILLTPTGRVAYAGPATKLVPFFGAVGLEPPLHENPLDYALDVLTGRARQPGQGPEEHLEDVDEAATVDLADVWARGAPLLHTIRRQPTPMPVVDTGPNDSDVAPTVAALLRADGHRHDGDFADAGAEHVDELPRRNSRSVWTMWSTEPVSASESAGPAASAAAAEPPPASVAREEPNDASLTVTLDEFRDYRRHAYRVAVDGAMGNGTVRPETEEEIRMHWYRLREGRPPHTITVGDVWSYERRLPISLRRAPGFWYRVAACGTVHALAQLRRAAELGGEFAATAALAVLTGMLAKVLDFFGGPCPCP